MPDYNGHAHRSGGHDVIDVEPLAMVGKGQALHHDRQVDKVAKVQEEVLVLLRLVVDVPPQNQQRHENAVETEKEKYFLSGKKDFFLEEGHRLFFTLVWYCIIVHIIVLRESKHFYPID